MCCDIITSVGAKIQMLPLLACSVVNIGTDAVLLAGPCWKELNIADTVGLNANFHPIQQLNAPGAEVHNCRECGGLVADIVQNSTA